MLKREDERYSNDAERRPLLTNRELYDECLHAAATIAVAFVFGCEFKDCLLDDDGYGWPTPVARVDLTFPDGWRWEREALPAVAAIHEAGAMAIAKMHGRGPHCIETNVAHGRNSVRLLDDPVIWKTIKLLARFIENNDEGGGAHGAGGTDLSDDGEDTAAIALIKSEGLTLGCRWRWLSGDDGDDA